MESAPRHRSCAWRGDPGNADYERRTRGQLAGGARRSYRDPPRPPSQHHARQSGAERGAGKSEGPGKQESGDRPGESRRRHCKDGQPAITLFAQACRLSIIGAAHVGDLIGMSPIKY